MSAPIQLDAAVVVQVELAIIGAGLGLLLRMGWRVVDRLRVIDTKINGPDGDGKEGMIARVDTLAKEIAFSEHFRLRTVAEYISWRRRVESTLNTLSPAFALTPEHVLLDLITGESPE